MLSLEDGTGLSTESVVIFTKDRAESAVLYTEDSAVYRRWGCTKYLKIMLCYHLKVVWCCLLKMVQRVICYLLKIAQNAVLSTEDSSECCAIC